MVEKIYFILNCFIIVFVIKNIINSVRTDWTGANKGKCLLKGNCLKFVELSVSSDFRDDSLVDHTKSVPNHCNFHLTKIAL